MSLYIATIFRRLFIVLKINKRPARINAHLTTAIYNIFTNSVFNNSLETGIIQTDILDHFPIYLATKRVNLSNNILDLSNHPSNINKISKKIRYK